MTYFGQDPLDSISSWAQKTLPLKVTFWLILRVSKKMSNVLLAFWRRDRRCWIIGLSNKRWRNVRRYLLDATSFITSCSTRWCGTTWEWVADIQSVMTDCGWMGILSMLIQMHPRGFCRSSLGGRGLCWPNTYVYFNRRGANSRWMTIEKIVDE